MEFRVQDAVASSGNLQGPLWRNSSCTGLGNSMYVHDMDDPWKHKMPSTYRPSTISLVLKNHWSIGEQKPLEPDAGTGMAIPRRPQSTDPREYPFIPCLQNRRNGSSPTRRQQLKQPSIPKPGTASPNHAAGSE